MVDLSESDLVQRLDVKQKRALIVRIFEDAAIESRKSAGGYLSEFRTTHLYTYFVLRFVPS